MFHLIDYGYMFRAEPNIFEDNCTVEGYEYSSTQSLEGEENTAEGKRPQKGLVSQNIKDGDTRNIVLLSNNLLQLLHLRFNVIVDTTKPLQCWASFTLSAISHEPDRGFWQKPTETEKDDTEEAECGIVDVDRDDQADTQTQQPANVDPISVEGG